MGAGPILGVGPQLRGQDYVAASVRVRGEVGVPDPAGTYLMGLDGVATFLIPVGSCGRNCLDLPSMPLVLFCGEPCGEG